MHAHSLPRIVIGLYQRTTFGIMWVTFGHLRPSGRIMLIMEVIEAPRTAGRAEVHGLSKQSGTCGSFIEDQSAASSEDGSEVSYRSELSAADLPVRSVWVGNTTCAFDSTVRYHAADDYGCGACQDRHSSTVDDGPSNHGAGPHIALPGVLGGDLRHRPEPGGRHRRRCATGYRRRPLNGELGRDLYSLGQDSQRLLEPGDVCRAARAALLGRDGLWWPASHLTASARRLGTPIGLFPFGTTVYGNSTVSPTTRYPYHHLVCGDWWDEQPGSSTYDTFQHVPCGITPPYGDDSEALWTEIQPYQHFIDIKMPDPPDNGAGIFLHDDMPEGYTEGCVALPNAELDAVLGWLNPADAPHILIAVS